MKNIKLVLEYDGTNYMGWQKQPNAETVQGAVERAVEKLTKEHVSVTGCSRTDSRVHALSYVCNFKTNSTVPPNKYREALNFYLPEDIAVTSCCEVDNDFHSRYDSKGKMYSYTILNTESRRPLSRNTSYQFKGNLNVDDMIEAAQMLVGTHDFAAFRNLGSSAKTTVRTVTELRIDKENDYIKIYIAADGFLYNMARIIVGTLIDVGSGKIKPEEIINIINSKDRTKAGKTSPAQGLCLVEVYY